MMKSRQSWRRGTTTPQKLETDSVKPTHQIKWFARGPDPAGRSNINDPQTPLALGRPCLNSRRFVRWQHKTVRVQPPAQPPDFPTRGVTADGERREQAAALSRSRGTACRTSPKR
eukprot:4374561-Prymnesium_polylepis.1